jgi:hypothetical protein
VHPIIVLLAVIGGGGFDNAAAAQSSSGGSAQSPLGVGSTGALNLLGADPPVVPSALGALALAGMGMLLLRRKGGSYS